MQILMNDGWSFAKLPSGSVFADADNAGFNPVDLPHDWLIWQEDNLYENADAWYRRTIELPDEHEPNVFIRFDGVYMDCDVFLNGELIKSHPYGYTAFDVSLTGRIRKGKNQLTVHIRHQSPNSRWYSGSGIFRDVFLMLLPQDYMIPDSLYLAEKQTGEDWKLDVSVNTAGVSEQRFLCTIKDHAGRCITETEGDCSNGTAKASLIIPKGKAWSPENPYLYHLEVRYGTHCECYKIGLRSVLLDPNKGLLLNGKQTKLKGVCLHHDLGALGSAFHPKAARRQLNMMKKMGANAVRTSHNPPASSFLDLCDEMGFMVVDEAFDMWERPKTEYDYARFFNEWYSNDIASWIRRDRRHPSVIMWSIGNEIYDIHADQKGQEITKKLCDEVRIHDPLKHAYTTFGCNYMPWEGGQRCAEIVDAVGYNYGEKLYEYHHDLHPDWVIYGSETASVLSSRGIYHFPIEQSIMSEADRQCSALGNSNTSWGAESLVKILIDDEQNTFSMGQFIWSGIDYIGEPTPYHTRSCYFGQADTACFPKDSYYLFQSFWNENKMIHIGVSWDWNPGQLIDIPVITNCSAAELFLNEKSMGRKEIDRHDPERCVPVWKIPFIPGEIRAVGYDGSGNQVCEKRCVTPGETHHLVMTSENPYILSDGWDLVFVDISAADQSGNPVENARDYVKISVSGGGRLLGTDNGDSTDPDGYKADCRRLFSGKLLAIIASNGKQEDVSVCLTRTNGETYRLTIPVRNALPKQGISFLQQAASKPLTSTVHARKIKIEPLGPTTLNSQMPECRFRWTILPEDATDYSVTWQVTNAAGIESPYVRITEKNDIVTVRAYGDGSYYLRALCIEDQCCAFISQFEFSASGMGSPALNPYQYISAGLYDCHEGDIGAGNEKGIAFSRDGESMVGFSCVDFGRTGSDTITADIFALNGDAYNIELSASSPGQKKRRIGMLHYQKPSIWNVYQAETWRLPERLTGIQSLFFTMNDKIHMKGFSFEKQQNAYIRHSAGSADSIYGDSFSREGETVKKIGNNVTLIWNDMDFGGKGEVLLEIEGRTNLAVNTISIRIKNKQGEEVVSVAEYDGKRYGVQQFRVTVPDGNCTVSFVFLPGSSFDFDSFRFQRRENWTEETE